MKTITSTLFVALLAAGFNASAAIVDISGSLNTYETLVVDNPLLQDEEVSPGNHRDRILAATSLASSGDATEIDWMTSTLDFLGVAHDPLTSIQKIEFGSEAETDAFWTDLGDGNYSGEILGGSHYLIKIGEGHVTYDTMLLENLDNLLLATISLGWLAEISGFDGRNFDIYRISHVSAVPAPAAFWLFGSALIGFIAVSRRTKLS